MEREKMLNVRMAAGELAMLKDLADHMGLSQSDVVRQLVRRAHAEAFSPAPPKPKPKRK